MFYQSYFVNILGSVNNKYDRNISQLRLTCTPNSGYRQLESFQPSGLGKLIMQRLQLLLGNNNTVYDWHDTSAILKSSTVYFSGVVSIFGVDLLDQDSEET